MGNIRRIDVYKMCTTYDANRSGGFMAKLTYLQYPKDWNSDPIFCFRFFAMLVVFFCSKMSRARRVVEIG